MTDEMREKVIEGLKWCMNEEHDCYIEKGCPYENEGEDVGCIYALHRDALELLKAQEPVEPTKPDEDNMAYCGVCGSPVGYEVLEPSGMDYVRYHYCTECGRAVKWE